MNCKPRDSPDFADDMKLCMCLAPTDPFINTLLQLGVNGA